jgi:hypothetical protein
MDRTLQQHINDNRDELNNPNTSGQRRRHLEGELDSLEQFQTNHPDENQDPTPLELYCDTHPDALQCRMFDD